MPSKASLSLARLSRDDLQHLVGVVAENLLRELGHRLGSLSQLALVIGVLSKAIEFARVAGEQGKGHHDVGISEAASDVGNLSIDPKRIRIIRIVPGLSPLLVGP